MQGGNTSWIKVEKLILPGDKIGVIEEFLYGDGAYEQDGVIRSQVLGDARLDLERRVAEVLPRTRKPVFPKEGSEVLGEIGEVKRPTASIDIFKIDGETVEAPFTGILHFSSMSREYSSHMSLAVKEGDIVKANVINMKNLAIQVSIQGPEYGVVYAFCSKCGDLLELRRTRLVCPNCGRVEKRKTSEFYGRENLL